MAMIVYKCFHGPEPPYLADDCMPVTTEAGRRHLWSFYSPRLVVPGIKTVLGTHNFAVACPLVWNSLPANIRSATVSLQTFARRLVNHRNIEILVFFDLDLSI